MKKTLKEIFDNAWCDMEVIYNTGAICSERHMQCELFRLLKNDETFNQDYQVFVEPKLSGLVKGKIPDMIITTRIHNESNNDETVAVVELKYVPFHFPEFEEDLEKLIFFIKNKKDIILQLNTNPITGDWADKSYSISDNIFIIYCVIGKVDSYIIERFKEACMSTWKLDAELKFENIKYLQYVGAIAKEQSWYLAGEENKK